MADAFVIQVGPTGRTLVHSTYLGGRHADVGADIAVDARGRAYVTGRTHSDDFPLRNTFQRRPGSPGCRDVYGCPDAFLAKVE
jgi:hypothetical protein